MKIQFRNYSRLVKFEHTLFALPFAMIGFFLATKQPSMQLSPALLIKVIGCMVFARNAAMAFNRYLDRSFDAANPRTATREIPAGVVSAKNAKIFVLANSVLFIAVSWSINFLCFCLSPVALLVILGYSYTKRITALCHFVLSTGLALAPIGAYLAVTGEFALIPLLFSGIVFFWVSGFDIIYACQDIDFDRSWKLNSVPAMFGVRKSLRISSLIHSIAFAMVILAGVLMEGNLMYWIGAAAFSSLLLYQHMIIASDDLSRVNLAFGTTNGVASVLFAVFVILSLYFDI